MNLIRKNIYALALALLAISTRANACSCADEPEKVSDFIKDKVVFYGRPIKSEWRPRHKNTPDVGFLMSSNSVLTTFENIDLLWGKAPKEIQIRHESRGASCGFSFAIGSTLLMIANKTDTGDLTSGLCLVSKIPEGAILEYIENGTDPVVSSRHWCGIPIYEDSDAGETHCEFWEEENITRIRERWQEYRRETNRFLWK